MAGTSRRRVWWLIAAVVVAAGAATALWAFAPWTLFVDKHVDEALPSASASATPQPGISSTSGTAAPPAPVVLASGRFRSYEHETTGTASLVRLSDGRIITRLSDFETSNGPDVRVWLSGARADDADSARQDKYLDLGALKGNVGNQNYPVPTGVDLSDYQSVIIWCRRFTVAFGAAPVIPAPASNQATSSP